MVIVADGGITDNAEGRSLGLFVYRMVGDKIYLVTSADPLVKFMLENRSNGASVQLFLEALVVKLEVPAPAEAVLDAGGSLYSLGEVVLHLQDIIIERILGSNFLGLCVQVEATLEDLN